MELTREVIADMATCTERGCLGCKGVCGRDPVSTGIETLAKQLLAEMDKPKVWEGAHEWQDRARVKHYSNSALCAMDETFKDYTRTLPKSRIDEIAEEAQSSFLDGTNKPLTEVIKSAILKDREERH